MRLCMKNPNIVTVFIEKCIFRDKCIQSYSLSVTEETQTFKFLHFSQ